MRREIDPDEAEGPRVEEFWNSSHACFPSEAELYEVKYAEGGVPALPTILADDRHRVKCKTPWIPNAITTKPMNRKEAQASPKAKAAMDMQWTRLRNRMAWDESSVREWSDVAAEARRKSQEVHMGMLFGFDVEKNLDVPEGDPRRKFKGRAVFQGNKVVS